MSYKWITKYNSPNYTKAANVVKTWGRKRTIEAIAIHWWGDPATNPSFQGVINTLCDPNRGASAHLVATGTDRQVACLVNLGDASWATNSANPYTISIECDPRCRNEDYDVVAEVIAQLRQVYGDLPLVPHRQFVATQCPGNYDLGRLDREARKKIAKPEWDWGHVENPHVPVVTTRDEAVETKIPFEVVRRPEADKPTDWEQEVQAGKEGIRTVITRITYTDGKETERKVISDTTSQPVEHVIFYGTKSPETAPEEPQEPETGTNPSEPETPVIPPSAGTLKSIILAISTWVMNLLKNIWNAKK